MNTRWAPVTERDGHENIDAIPFTLTKNDRDTAQLVRLEIAAMQRANSQFVPGIVAKELRREDLTDSEREAFGL